MHVLTVWYNKKSAHKSKERDKSTLSYQRILQAMIVLKHKVAAICSKYPLIALCGLLCVAISLGFLEKGGCPSCSIKSCSSRRTPCYKPPIPDLVCGCCPVCVKSEGKRCGGVRGVPCDHGLLCQYRVGGVMGEERMGICEREELCKERVCGYRQYCVVNDTDLTTSCTCLKYYFPEQWRYAKIHKNCEQKVNPLCGNDGVTYQSYCHLHQHECLTGRFVGVAYMGKCEVVDSVVSTDVTNKKYLLMTNNYLPQDPPVCSYHGQVFQPGTINPIPHDPCRYVVCSPQSVPYIAPVPGCPGNPPEIDYGITLPPKAGGWSWWSHWSPCTGECTGGTSRRSRTCTNPRPENEGEYCRGVAEQTKRCCPPDCDECCEYSPWSPWAPCSTSCGAGYTYRNRSVTNNVDPEVAERVCHVAETRRCNERKICPISTGLCKRRSLGAKHPNLYNLPIKWNSYLCYTYYEFEKRYCGGDCPSKNGTACFCRPVKYTFLKFKLIKYCGPYPILFHDVPIVEECGCVEEGGGVPLPFEPGD